jgi:hypothetical protein
MYWVADESLEGKSSFGTDRPLFADNIKIGLKKSDVNVCTEFILFRIGAGVGLRVHSN